MITKEGFVKLIELIRKDWQDWVVVSKPFQELYHEPLPHFSASIVDGILDFVTLEMGAAAGDDLSWWLYDAPNGIEGDCKRDHLWAADGTPIPCRTPAQLYDYLNLTSQLK